MEVTLARLMKIKKRAQEQISRIATDIFRYNSVAEGAERDGVDITEWMQKYDDLMNYLIELKKRQSMANAQGDFLELFYRKNEVIGKIALLKKLNTNHGVVPSPYEERDFTYTAILRKQDVDSMVSNLEKELDGIQDKIDQFNNSTMVVIPTSPV